MSRVKVIVVDLDGCLCSINSFRAWLLYSLIYLLITLRLFRVATLLTCFTKRILGRIDRVAMKVVVLKQTEDLSSGSVRLFCSILNIFTNQQVVSIMQRYDSNEQQRVLCTAAPEVYASVYAERFDFAQVFASRSVFTREWRENIGPVKLENLREFYGESMLLEHVITDHHDDLPLLLESRRCTLVQPSDVTLAAIDGAFEFEVI